MSMQKYKKKSYLSAFAENFSYICRRQVHHGHESKFYGHWVGTVLAT